MRKNKLKQRNKVNGSKPDTVSRVLVTLLIVTGTSVVTVAGFLIFYLWGYYRDKKAYDSIRELSVSVSEQPVDIQGDSEEDNREYLDIDFDGLMSVNSDVNAWLYACEGKISGPVVSSKDDEYYLNHRFDGALSSGGTFFTDRFCSGDYSDDITVIYGHNRRDGSMFKPVMSYVEEEYYITAPGFVIYTPEEISEYDIFAVLQCDYAQIPWLYERSRFDGLADKETPKEELIQKILDMSIYDTGIIPGVADKIVILCTCEYSGTNNRLLVYGVKRAA